MSGKRFKARQVELRPSFQGDRTQTQLGHLVTSCCDPRGSLDGDKGTHKRPPPAVSSTPEDHLRTDERIQTKYGSQARSQSRRRKHVLSLMTECQDCPCWGKEACQGVCFTSQTATSDTADLR